MSAWPESDLLPDTFGALALNPHLKDDPIMLMKFINF